MAYTAQIQLKRDPGAATRAAHAGVTVGQLVGRYIERGEAIEPLERSNNVRRGPLTVAATASSQLAGGRRWMPTTAV